MKLLTALLFFAVAFSSVFGQSYPPIISSTPVIRVQYNHPYEYQVVNYNQGNPILRYYFEKAPSFLHIDSLTGLIKGVPQHKDLGDYEVLVRVSDGKYLAGQLFFLTVYDDPRFEDRGISIPGEGPIALGDFDNDGDLDIARGNGIFRNDGNYKFTYTGTNPGGNYKSLSWNDYDNDGDLDLLAGPLIFKNLGQSNFSKYANLYGYFVNPQYKFYSSVWGDFNNDGNQDVIIGDDGYRENNSNFIACHIYLNNRNEIFDSSSVFFKGGEYSILKALELNNDGYLDVIQSGVLDALSGMISPKHAAVWKNNAGTMNFSPLLELKPLLLGSVDACDLDANGKIDFVYTGYYAEKYNISATNIFLYKQDSKGAFSHVEINSHGILNGNVMFGDYDNDGDPDMLISGQDSYSGMSDPYYPASYNRIISFILNNDGNGNFTNICEPVETSSFSAWGDMDNDGDLDLIVGNKLYINNFSKPDMPPSPPEELSASVKDNLVTISWKPGSDPETPVKGLTYNLRVGTKSGAEDVFSSMSDYTTGQRRIPNAGNVYLDTLWNLYLKPGVYYASVQSVDNSFIGSKFSKETIIFVGVDSIEVGGVIIPSKPVLKQNYPNPFNPNTKIDYSIPEAMHVKLAMYDVLGKEISILVNENQDAGKHSVQFNGSGFPSGVYVYIIQAGEFRDSKKLVLLK